MEGIQEPVAPGTAALLRRATLDHARVERRRRFPPLLHAGVPGVREELFATAERDRLDHGLRTDVVAVLLGHAGRRHAAPLLWLTRPGPLELQDVDAAWLSAARSAGGEAGVPVTLVVVNRHGWADPRSGVRREWKRLRDR